MQPHSYIILGGKIQPGKCYVSFSFRIFHCEWVHRWTAVAFCQLVVQSNPWIEISDHISVTLIFAKRNSAPLDAPSSLNINFQLSTIFIFTINFKTALRFYNKHFNALYSNILLLIATRLSQGHCFCYVSTLLFKNQFWDSFNSDFLMIFLTALELQLRVQPSSSCFFLFLLWPDEALPILWSEWLSCRKLLSKISVQLMQVLIQMCLKSGPQIWTLRCFKSKCQVAYNWLPYQNVKLLISKTIWGWIRLVVSKRAFVNEDTPLCLVSIKGSLSWIHIKNCWNEKVQLFHVRFVCFVLSWIRGRINRNCFYWTEIASSLREWFRINLQSAF